MKTRQDFETSAEKERRLRTNKLREELNKVPLSAFCAGDEFAALLRCHGAGNDPLNLDLLGILEAVVERHRKNVLVMERHLQNLDLLNPMN